MYCHADPINGIDPSGEFLAGLTLGFGHDERHPQCLQFGRHGSGSTRYGSPQRGWNADIAATRSLLSSFVEQAVGFAIGFGASAITPIVSRVATKLGSSGSKVWGFISRAFGNHRIVSLSKAAAQGVSSHGALLRQWYKILDDIPANSVLHHIVEQGRGVGRFGADAIHSLANSVMMPRALHDKITGLYNSSKKAFSPYE